MASRSKSVHNEYMNASVYKSPSYVEGLTTGCCQVKGHSGTQPVSVAVSVSVTSTVQIEASVTVSHFLSSRSHTAKHLDSERAQDLRLLRARQPRKHLRDRLAFRVPDCAEPVSRKA